MLKVVKSLYDLPDFFILEKPLKIHFIDLQVDLPALSMVALHSYQNRLRIQFERARLCEIQMPVHQTWCIGIHRQTSFGVATLNTPQALHTQVMCPLALFTCRHFLSCPELFSIVKAATVFWEDTEAATVN